MSNPLYSATSSDQKSRPTLCSTAADQARGLSVRGGAAASADSAEDDSEDSLDDDDFEDEDGDGLMDEEDFGEANIVDRFKQDWKKTPIITKTFFRVRTMYEVGFMCHA